MTRVTGSVRTFEPNDPELGTMLVPSRDGRPPLSASVGEYCRAHLPQSISSPKEIGRIRKGLLLLAEFEGDLPIGQVSADTLRHFRETHLAKMPAKENAVRQQLQSTSMTESVKAIQRGDWPLMSAAERDLRVQWLYRMFEWFNAQKWLTDGPSTGLRGESVLTKIKRKQAASQAVQPGAIERAVEVVADEVVVADVAQVDADLLDRS